MEVKERLNALETALNNEMKEREFYLINAEKTTNPLGKAMFKQIADEELEHYERLKELHARWVKQDKWPETIPLEVNNTNIREILSGMQKDMDRSAKTDAGDLEAVRTAIAFEEKGFLFYQELRDSSTDPRERKFFDLLSMIEHEHYLSLRSAEEYFTDPVSWFTRMEHHALDAG